MRKVVDGGELLAGHEEWPVGAGPTASPLLHMPVVELPRPRPFWHRPDPLVAVTPIDPGCTQLRQHFPGSWQHLVRVKTLVDAIASVAAPGAGPQVTHHRRIAPLLTATAQELTQFAVATDVRHSPAVGTQAHAAARRIRHFGQTGQWQPVTLAPPAPGEPWLYCGPLSTWAMHATLTPLAFLLVAPRPDLQSEADRIDANIGRIQDVIAAALGGPIRSAREIRPTMHVSDVLLAGGESASGHKHFAHFFPLEAPMSSVDEAEFTVVFSNIHASRLRRCSMELIRHYAPGHREGGDDLLRASLSWFRGHDLAHFWRLAGVAASDGGSGDALTAFEAMTLEEAYADVLGLLSAASLGENAALSQAFGAELLRYLSRACSFFADSSAAALTAGWLLRNGVTSDIGTQEWLSAALAPLASLARIIHRVLWESGDHELGELRAAFDDGQEFGARLSALYATVPTDIEYIFG